MLRFRHRAPQHTGQSREVLQGYHDLQPRERIGSASVSSGSQDRVCGKLVRSSQVKGALKNSWLWLFRPRPWSPKPPRCPQKKLRSTHPNTQTHRHTHAKKRHAPRTCAPRPRSPGRQREETIIHCTQNPKLQAFKS